MRGTRGKPKLDKLTLAAVKRGLAQARAMEFVPDPRKPEKPWAWGVMYPDGSHASSGHEETARYMATQAGAKLVPLYPRTKKKKT